MSQVRTVGAHISRFDTSVKPVQGVPEVSATRHVGGSTATTAVSVLRRIR